MNKKIEFGILCNGLVFEAWEASCIEHLLSHKHIVLKLLVIKEQEATGNQSFIQKLKQYPYRNFFYRFYKRYLLKANSYRQISLEEQLKNYPKIFCKIIHKNKFDEYFSEDDVNKIKENQLDFLLRFGFNIIKGSILQSCRYGVWSFHHADNEFIRGGPIGFWEIFLSKNTSAAVLQQLNNELDKGKILRKGYLKTVDHSFSENIDQLTQMAAVWPLQVCIDILNEVSIFNYPALETPKGKLYKYPKNITFIYFLFTICINKLKFHYNQLFKAESWQIARFDCSFEQVINNEKLQPSYKSESFAEYYSADPFFLPTSKSNKILFEYYSYKEQIGKIAISDFNGKEFKILSFENNVHRSYPYCLEHNNELYCIPEQAASGKVTLYKIDEEGNTAKVCDLLPDFGARDVSLIYFEDKWWLFCTKANEFENAGLHIFYSSNLQEQFKAHENNPVKVDVCNARPAGSLFIKEGVLYRFAQNSAAHYGHKLNLNMITKLGTSVFEEKKINELKASQFGNYCGIHHINIHNNQILIDLKSFKFSFQNFKHQFKRKIKRLG
jgi:hypothetical protein